MKKLILLLLILLIPYNSLAYDKAVVDINNLSINELQEYVDKGYLTYEKITKLYLDRIDAYNKQYNAIITINEHALDEAKELDKTYKENGRTSMIFGLPVLVKDNIDVKGMPTTNGTKALLDSYPNENADVIQKLIDNGAIIIGKTNMDEFAFNAKYSHSSFGYTYNAFNTDYSSYGSSGGSAVSVSANLAVYALGTDTGVSVRVPSSANGVIGMRPTIDIMSGNGVIKFESTRDVVGVITKYVSDSAIVLDIIDNVDIKYSDYLTNDLKEIKIAAIKGFYNPNSNSSSIAYGKTDKFIYDMMNESIEKLKSLGAEIIYLDSFSLPYQFDATTMCYEFNEYIKNTSSKIKSLNDLIKNGGYTQYIESYNGYYCNHDYKETTTYKNYINNRNSYIDIANKKFDNNGIDAIIYPTIKRAIFTNQEANDASNVSTPSSNIAPLVGYPAMTIPMGKNNEFSYGLEIVTKANNESTIYKIASSFESINKIYKTPAIAPSLYEISDNTKNLLNYYETNKNDNTYIKTNEKTLEYIKNYDGNEDTINKLIYEYQNPEEFNKIEENKNNTIYYILLFSIISLIIVLILIHLKISKIKRKSK